MQSQICTEVLIDRPLWFWWQGSACIYWTSDWGHNGYERLNSNPVWLFLKPCLIVMPSIRTGHWSCTELCYNPEITLMSWGPFELCPLPCMAFIVMYWATTASWSCNFLIDGDTSQIWAKFDFQDTQCHCPHSLCLPSRRLLCWTL